MIVTFKQDSANCVDSYYMRKKIERVINNETRFTCETESISQNRFKIHQVRLKDSKQFCGSHPYACEIGTSRRAKYLEGADWVEFNDYINDIFDEENVSAWIRTSVCEIRMGRSRRTVYDGEMNNPSRNEYRWFFKAEPHQYEDWCGEVAPNSKFPEGTPGLYERNVDHV